MIINLKNIGVFKQTKYATGDLTVICGENNTGKTYATYSLYGFFDFWNKAYFLPIEDTILTDLLKNGVIEFKLKSNLDNLNRILNDACKDYSKMLSRILAAQEKYFSDSFFHIELENKDLKILKSYQRTWRSGKSDFIQISKSENSDILSVSLLIPSEDINNQSLIINIRNAISTALKEIQFSNIITNIFISSAERTGAVIFKNELNFEKNILINEATNSEEIDLFDIFSKIYKSNYALPVRQNIAYIRKLDEVINNNSFIAKYHPEIISTFEDIVGGSFKVNKEGLFFVPQKSRVRLNLGEGSSSVRSLLDLSFYLNYTAIKGDILMIDEPELNLHPSNQRKLARLFVKLTKIGIRLFITTHSDYILKEFNTLIMLTNNIESPHVKTLMRKYKYTDQELIDASKFKVYVSKKEKVLLDCNKKRTTEQTLVEAPIDNEYGIDVESFDKTIDEMNFIQEQIIFGG